MSSRRRSSVRIANNNKNHTDAEETTTTTTTTAPGRREKRKKAGKSPSKLELVGDDIKSPVSSRKRRGNRSKISTPRNGGRKDEPSVNQGGSGRGVGREKEKRSKRRKVKEEEEKEEKKRKSMNRGTSQSCHQCRQSIHSSKGVSEVKSGRERIKCSTCTRFWCEQCLLNRYGVVKETVAVETWVCPVCSKMCNCSLCRKKEGKLATGILTPLVKGAGFGNVSHFLSEGTNDIARILQWKSSSSTATSVTSLTSSAKSGSSKRETVKKSRKREREPSSSSPPSSSQSPTFLPHLSDNDIDAPPPNKLPSISTSTDSGVHSPSTPSPPPLRSPVSSVSMTTASSPVDNGDPFVWRSPRKRTLTQRFSFDKLAVQRDISRKVRNGEYEKKMGERRYEKEVVDEEEKVEEEEEVEDKEEEVEEEEEEEEEEEDEVLREKEWQEKQGKLEDLRKQQFHNLKSEHVRQKQEERKTRHREREERRREREEKDELKRIAREIQREFQRGGAGGGGARVEEEEEGGVERKGGGEYKELPPLPYIPPLVLPVATQLVSRVLSVTEFLSTFSESEVIRIPSSLTTIDKMIPSLTSELGPEEVYKGLLQLLHPSSTSSTTSTSSSSTPTTTSTSSISSSTSSTLRISKSRWEEMAVGYLHSKGITVETGSGEGNEEEMAMCQRVQHRLTVLEHLINLALDSPAVATAIDAASNSAYIAKVEGRIREKERTKTISEELKCLSSLEEIEEKRSEIVCELSAIQRDTHVRQYRSSQLARSSCLGEDRLGRKYWLLKSIPGVVVEEVCGGVAQRDNEGAWLHINSKSLLTTLMEVMKTEDMNIESSLLGNLQKLHPIISSSLNYS